MKTIELEDTEIYKIYHDKKDISLPNNRNMVKDTEKFLLFINTKTEFLKDSIQKNPWNSSHFAWMDFNISHMFHTKQETYQYLKFLGFNKRIQFQGLTIPGCSNKENIKNMDTFLNNIYWRFCGVFFLGDLNSVSDFCNLYDLYFPSFLDETKKLVWEVNFWSWLESTKNWNPIWYSAIHNDNVVKIPSRFLSAHLFPLSDSILSYNYPFIEHFLPGSSSFISYQGKEYINTRYINYEIQPTGCYLYKGYGHIESKNIVSELNTELFPISYTEMNENIDLPSKETSFSKGLEDIRLFEYQNTVWFVASNVNYSSNNKIRIMIGKYDLGTYECKDARSIEAPYQTECEKNWIPIVSDENLSFIYKWYPMEIGSINWETNTLEIVKRIPISSPIFEKIRGSTTFISDPDENGNLVGVVHFSDETVPRQYFHMLVVLEKETFVPLKYTEFFYFEKPTIEFCIGFTMIENKYKFWISRMDIDPLLVSVEKNKIPFCFDIV